MYCSSSLVATFGILMGYLALVSGAGNGTVEMVPLSSDDSFHFEILRILGHARYGGSDIAEVLTAAGGIEPGNFTSFSSTFLALAERTHSSVDSINPAQDRISLRDAFFSASNYYRAADFYLHGSWADPLINDLWAKQAASFQTAISLLPVPGQLVSIKADGFEIPAIFYAVDPPRGRSPKRRPTLIVGNGYDGSQEEMLHVVGLAALERGWNVITYEGPGQPTVRRNQNLGFITEWEKVVTPVVDYLHTRRDVDTDRLGLYGYSFGAWLATRAAAFEHRISAVVAIDGIYDVGASFLAQLPHPLQDLFSSSRQQELDAAINQALASPHAPTQLRWAVEQGLWSFKLNSSYAFLNKTKEMTMEGLTERVTAPVFVGAAEDDIFFKGQPEQLKEALGSKATFYEFKSEDGSGSHCQVGAAVTLNRVVFSWLDEVLGNK